MADRKKRSSRDDGSKKHGRKYSANTSGPIVLSEKGQLRIGNYILGRTLGHGTFGKVKRKFCEILYILYMLIILYSRKTYV